MAADVVALWEALEVRRGATPSEPPFWAAAWPGGQALARYVLDHPGAGGRPVGARPRRRAAAWSPSPRRSPGPRRWSPARSTPSGAAAIAVNAEDNGVGPFEVVGDVLDGEPDPDVDVVLAGDVCYDRAMTERVLPYLDAAGRGGAAVSRRPGPALRAAGAPDRGRRLRRPGHRGAPGAPDHGLAAALALDLDHSHSTGQSRQEAPRVAVDHAGSSEMDHDPRSAPGIVTDR